MHVRGKLKSFIVKQTTFKIAVHSKIENVSGSFYLICSWVALINAR
jgi:hypothetical protein